MWRHLPDLRAEKDAQNPVTSLVVMVFSVPSRRKRSTKTNFFGVLRRSGGAGVLHTRRGWGRSGYPLLGFTDLDGPIHTNRLIRANRLKV